MYSDGTYRIKDSNGLFVGISDSDSEITKNSNVVLWTESTYQTQNFVLTKLKTVASVTPTPTPTTPTPEVKPTEKPEVSLVPSKVESITRETSTNKNTIKDGWYYFVCQNNYISVNNTQAILTKEEYANQFYLTHMGGTMYTIRSMFNTYLSNESVSPRSGDKVPAKTIRADEGNVDGWIIKIDPKTNVCTIHPLSNKNLSMGASSNKIALLDATKANNAAKITLVPAK